MVSTDDLQQNLADRLRRSLKVAGVSRAEMPDYLGVHTETVGAWVNGRAKPQSMMATLTLWAHKTGVPYEWLRYGEWPGATVTNGDEAEVPVSEADDEAELSLSELLRQIATALQQMADNFEPRT